MSQLKVMSNGRAFLVASKDRRCSWKSPYETLAGQYLTDLLASTNAKLTGNVANGWGAFYAVSATPTILELANGQQHHVRCMSEDEGFFAEDLIVFLGGSLEKLNADMKSVHAPKPGF